MHIIDGIPVWGVPLPEAVDQMRAICNNEIRPAHVALMADHHIGYSVPIGGVVAYEGHINVNGVGFDIGCGNKAVRLDCDATKIKSDIYRIMNDVQKHISFGMGRKNSEKVDHPLFDHKDWDELEVLKNLKDKARSQLGTVGSGNHYVDIFEDDLGMIWVGVHFGSRGLGHNIATHFIKASGGKDGIHAAPVILDENSDLGAQYIRCMELAGQYAYAGRDWVCDRMAKILQGSVTETCHNHHNFAWKEQHFGKDLWVVRKGATPNRPGQRSFVGGSMGSISVVLEGVEHESNAQGLYSTIHGAGRIYGRTQARGKFDRKGKCIRPGLIDKKLHDEYMKAFGPEVRGGDLDESPLAYKDIQSVVLAHSDSVRVRRVLRPIGVCMASSAEFDPYKD